MTRRELVNQIDKTRQKEVWIDLNDIAGLFGLDQIFYHTEQTSRLKCFWTKVWLCTDTFVGERAYFLDDEFVVYSVQKSRKSSENFYFASEEARDKLFAFIMSLIEKDELTTVDSNYLDMEIEPKYTVEFNTQIIHKKGWYEGQLVNIVNTQFPYPSEDHFHSVEIDLHGKRINIMMDGNRIG